MFFIIRTGVQNTQQKLLIDFPSVNYIFTDLLMFWLLNPSNTKWKLLKISSITAVWSAYLSNYLRCFLRFWYIIDLCTPVINFKIWFQNKYNTFFIINNIFHKKLFLLKLIYLLSFLMRLYAYTKKYTQMNKTGGGTGVLLKEKHTSWLLGAKLLALETCLWVTLYWLNKLYLVICLHINTYMNTEQWITKGNKFEGERVCMKWFGGRKQKGETLYIS